jgi:hypothetical protein
VRGDDGPRGGGGDGAPGDAQDDGSHDPQPLQSCSGLQIPQVLKGIFSCCWILVSNKISKKNAENNTSWASPVELEQIEYQGNFSPYSGVSLSF